MRPELVFLLEEPSAKAMLDTLLPRILNPLVRHRLIPFEGKQDLEKQLERKLRGYLNPDARFLIMRDQDSHADCKALKDTLVTKCIAAGKGNVSLVRIACRELESFYLADLGAVESALDIQGLRKLQGNAKYREPDRLGSPSMELHELTRGKYQKVGGSRNLGYYLDLDNTRSSSFSNLIQGIKRLELQLLNAM
ncbi:DUF4276 family protein [Herbaspirillum rubrisubalbicans]|uniref:DUF4276 domain-containing protein n=1 Tax=Herbaspirillum rubrisubalbicans TaxID=80842 RepID=A0AAD0U654_9BURK|nr:DUF4276 family protein [Herbaspirillum rubrisubalbicans]AYR23745.1 DUF4276 domain-containing protein [Herbaspirillum rubrisubalbicans]